MAYKYKRGGQLRTVLFPCCPDVEGIETDSEVPAASSNPKFPCCPDVEGIETGNFLWLRVTDIVNLKLTAAELGKYLHKETVINGKKHSKDVQIADCDMSVLIKWVLAQKK
jgi:hypothetical protein